MVGIFKSSVTFLLVKNKINLKCHFKALVDLYKNLCASIYKRMYINTYIFIGRHLHRHKCICTQTVLRKIMPITRHLGFLISRSLSSITFAGACCFLSTLPGAYHLVFVGIETLTYFLLGLSLNIN